MDYVLLGFLILVSLLLLFISWALRQARHTVDRLLHDIEEIKKQPP